jgi:hypothetical protein
MQFIQKVKPAQRYKDQIGKARDLSESEQFVPLGEKNSVE